MFNLEQAVADWRRQLAEAGIESPDVLDELESHLRDDLELQTRAGVDPRMAFESAVRRIGPAKALRDEFTKPSEARGRLRQRFVRGACFTTAAFVFLINTWTLLEFDLGVPERLAGGCLVILFTAYLASLPYLDRRLSRAAYSRLMAGVKFAGVLVPFIPIWFLTCHVIRFEPGYLPSLILWLVLTAVALTSIICPLSGSRGPEGGLGGASPPSWTGMPVLPPGPRSLPDFGIPIPPPGQFDLSARQTLAIAREEAARLGHDYIGTEHLLLGALKLATGAAENLLPNCCIESEAVRREIERLVVPQPAQPAAGELPLTPRARRALQFARKEASAGHDPLIQINHIVLGLLREGSGVAAKALKNLGVSVARIRKETKT